MTTSEIPGVWGSFYSRLAEGAIEIEQVKPANLRKY